MDAKKASSRNSPSFRPSPGAFRLRGRITKPYSFENQLPSANKIRNTVETLVSGRQRSAERSSLTRGLKYSDLTERTAIFGTMDIHK